MTAADAYQQELKRTHPFAFAIQLSGVGLWQVWGGTANEYREPMAEAETEEDAWREAVIQERDRLGKIQQRRRIAFQVMNEAADKLQALASDLRTDAYCGHRDNVIQGVASIEELMKTISSERSVIAAYAWLDELEKE